MASGEAVGPAGAARSRRSAHIMLNSRLISFETLAALHSLRRRIGLRFAHRHNGISIVQFRLSL